MKITIIGAGNVGRALGTAWRNRGHDVTFVVRKPDDPKYASLGAVRTNESAASAADVVALCTPWHGTQEAVQGCGDLAGKVVIDATNPLSPDFSTLEVWAPDARVCKAMNKIGAPMMDGPVESDFGFGLLRGRA